jgi:hypothetical protein
LQNLLTTIRFSLLLCIALLQEGVTVLPKTAVLPKTTMFQGVGVVNTFTLVQHNGILSTPTGSTYTYTPSQSIGTGNLGVLIVNNANVTTDFISSVANGGTWIVPAGCQLGQGSWGAVSCAYNLSTTSTSTLALTFAASSNYSICLFEYSFSPGPASLDTIPAPVNNGSSSTTQPGVAVTVNGASDVIVQSSIGATTANGPSSVSTYGNLLTPTNSNTGCADLENTTSGAAPTWTWPVAQRSGSNGISFK